MGRKSLLVLMLPALVLGACQPAEKEASSSSPADASTNWQPAEVRFSDNVRKRLHEVFMEAAIANSEDDPVTLASRVVQNIEGFFVSSYQATWRVTDHQLEHPDWPSPRVEWRCVVKRGVRTGTAQLSETDRSYRNIVAERFSSLASSRDIPGKLRLTDHIPPENVPRVRSAVAELYGDGDARCTLLDEDGFVLGFAGSLYVAWDMEMDDD